MTRIFFPLAAAPGPATSAGAPRDYAPAATGVTITNVTVSGTTMTVSVLESNSTAGIEISIDGTNYDTPGKTVFTNISAGTYRTIRARLVGVAGFNTWLLPVVVGPGGGGTPPPAATVTITNVTVSGGTITITATKANTTAAIEYSINGTDYAPAGQNVFTGQSAGTYNSITARLVGTATTYTWPQPVVVSAGNGGGSTPSVTITNVTVSENQITVTASKANSTAGIEISIDGTNYDTPGKTVFTAISNGTYNSITARLVGTMTTYTWPQAVVVNYTLVAYTGIKAQQPGQNVVYGTDADGFLVVSKSTSVTTTAFDAYCYGTEMIGYIGSAGLQGRFQQDGHTINNELKVMGLGLAPSKVTSVNALPYAFYSTDLQVGVLHNGNFVYGPTNFPDGATSVGFAHWVYSDRVEFVLDYFTPSDGLNHSLLLYTDPIAPVLPLIPHIFLTGPTTAARKLKIAGANLLPTPA